TKAGEVSPMFPATTIAMTIAAMMPTIPNRPTFFIATSIPSAVSLASRRHRLEQGRAEFVDVEGVHLDRVLADRVGLLEEISLRLGDHPGLERLPDQGRRAPLRQLLRLDRFSDLGVDAVGLVAEAERPLQSFALLSFCLGEEDALDQAVTQGPRLLY